MIHGADFMTRVQRSVMGAVLAAVVSLSWGYSTVLACGAAAYLIALLAIWKLPLAASRRTP